MMTTLKQCVVRIRFRQLQDAFAALRTYSARQKFAHPLKKVYTVILLVDALICGCGHMPDVGQ